jgi:hypothetical protein
VVQIRLFRTADGELSPQIGYSQKNGIEAVTFVVVGQDS